MASRRWYTAVLMPRFLETMTEGDHPAVRAVAAWAWNSVMATCVVGPLLLAQHLQQRIEEIARVKAALEDIENVKAQVEYLKKRKALWEYLKKRKAEIEGSE